MSLPRTALLAASCVALVAGSLPAQEAPWKPFGEVTRGSEVRSGLFTLYAKRDRAYLALAPAQLDQDFLLVTQISQGIGELGLDGGRTIRTDLVRFHRERDRVELWAVNPHFAASPGSPMARTVAYSFGHSIAWSFPIATVRQGEVDEVLLDLSPFLLSDWADVGGVLQTAVTARKLGATVSLDERRSTLQHLQLFPTNLEAEVRLTFGTPRGLALETVPDNRWIPVGVHYSLIALPAEPMRARFADDRVGYFISALKDFSRDTADGFFVRYINRWRLEKADPAAALSEPVRPITYYIDHTVPVEWRPYVRAGILEWNRAFEEAGFRNAVRVLDAPRDSTWSAADARYSTVRWTATHRSVYAIGPSSVDPRTGEILNADVLIAASWIQTWRGESAQYLSPVAAADAIRSEDSLAAAGAEGTLCSYGAGLARQGTVARALLAARGVTSRGGPVPRAFIGEALKALVMHEIGHTLGLRHNFRGSAGISAEQLADRERAETQGLGVSVMDYSPPALAADPRRQGHFFSPTVGSYDRWAITYGYGVVPAGPLSAAAADRAKGASGQMETWTPEVELNGLQAIASRAADPRHLFASDEDAGFGIYGLDPGVSRYDQTDDPLAWARERVALIDGLFDSLEARVVRPGQGYGRLRAAFTDLLTDRWYALLVTTKYLGGAVTARDHAGDPGARLPVTTVPVERQRAALAFLTTAGFGEQAYRFPPELLSRLGSDRWMHWGTSPSAQGRPDFPLHEWAAAQQGSLLARLLDPAVLARIRDAELRASPGGPTLGLPELFATLTDAIWTEVGTRGRDARSIGSVRRDLQRSHLNAMVRLVLAAPPGAPEDARAVARAILGELGTRIERALDGQRPALDGYTRAHLADSRERITQALAAPMLQATPLAR